MKVLDTFIPSLSWVLCAVPLFLPTSKARGAPFLRVMMMGLLLLLLLSPSSYFSSSFLSLLISSLSCSSLLDDPPRNDSRLHNYAVKRANACHFSFSSRLFGCGVHVFPQFEPEYIVVVNAFYPDGTSETKETIPSRGKVPVWNHLIEFDVTDRPVIYF